MFCLTLGLGLLGNASSQAVVQVRAGAMKLTVEHRFRTYKAVFTVVGERLLFRQTTALLDQVAPGVVGVFLIAPLFEPVVFHVIEAAGVEVQAVGGGVVAKLFAVDQFAGVTAVQLVVGFVLVIDLAAQFVEGADQFAGRVVLITAMTPLKNMYPHSTQARN